MYAKLCFEANTNNKLKKPAYFRLLSHFLPEMLFYITIIQFRFSYWR